MPTARAKKETATATRKVATKVETKTTVEEPWLLLKNQLKKKSKKRKRYLPIQIIFCVDQYVMVD